MRHYYRHYRHYRCCCCCCCCWRGGGAHKQCQWEEWKRHQHRQWRRQRRGRGSRSRKQKQQRTVQGQDCATGDTASSNFILPLIGVITLSHTCPCCPCFPCCPWWCQVILYCHGGGFFANLLTMDMRVVAALSQRTGAVMVVPGTNIC